jgi:hypothetical protein
MIVSFQIYFDLVVFQLFLKMIINLFSMIELKMLF